MTYCLKSKETLLFCNLSFCFFFSVVMKMLSILGSSSSAFLEWFSGTFTILGLLKSCSRGGDLGAASEPWKDFRYWWYMLCLWAETGLWFVLSDVLMLTGYTRLAKFSLGGERDCDLQDIVLTGCCSVNLLVGYFDIQIKLILYLHPNSDLKCKDHLLTFFFTALQVTGFKLALLPTLTTFLLSTSSPPLPLPLALSLSFTYKSV